MSNLFKPWAHYVRWIKPIIGQRLPEYNCMKYLRWQILIKETSGSGQGLLFCLMSKFRNILHSIVSIHFNTTEYILKYIETWDSMFLSQQFFFKFCVPFIGCILPLTSSFSECMYLQKWGSLLSRFLYNYGVLSISKKIILWFFEVYLHEQSWYMVSSISWQNVCLKTQ